MIKKLIYTIVIVFIGISISWAACTGGPIAWTTTPDEASVDTCLAGASNGDTVNVSAGDGTETWSTISIPSGVTLMGPGTYGSWPLEIAGTGPTLDGSARMSGFEFDSGVQVDVASGSDGWRIDNNKFEHSGVKTSVMVLNTDCTATEKHYSGLIDHNYFYNTRVIIDGCSSGYDDTIWYTNFKDYDEDDDKVYLEDNVILSDAQSGNWVDGNRSGRYVARYNIITESGFEGHGARSIRGLQSYEIYRNQITNAGVTAVLASNIRGGTGVIFDNNCDGTVGLCDWSIKIDRVVNSWGVAGYCDGNSTWDTEPHPAGFGEPNYLCRDSFAGRDASLGGSDEENPPDSQAALPAYYWGNTRDTINTWEASVGSNTGIEDRDFFMDDSSHANFGNGGVTTGIWADRPGTCDNNDGYWATDKGGDWCIGCDDGALYVCTSNEWGDEDGNTDEVGAYPRYTPYTYPHPLQGQSGSAEGVKSIGITLSPGVTLQ